MREIAVQFQCLVCHSQFIIVIDAVPGAQAFSGRAGTRRFEDTLEQIHEQKVSQDVQFYRCPTCIEVAFGMRYQEWSQEREAAIVLSPCRSYIYEDAAPIYINPQPDGHKPKWTLAHGVGPKVLETDNSRSGRIYAPSLRQFGVPMPIAGPTARDASWDGFELRTLLELLHDLSFQVPIEKLQPIYEQQPLLEHAAEIMQQLREIEANYAQQQLACFRLRL
eukprot:TRINITY_DN7269_c0_g1_i3.p1 TRINITY_DN7269_c0_g1~~TRINITY_DN7269_c0_g1_i3.p1  ORF type:complete len:221 (+),score=19.29 TRINITY_DN7269_c0_g1_i3:34-696(+)